MKIVMLIAAAGCVLLPGELAARQLARARTLFACTLENGKTARVTVQGDRFTFRLGTARRPELTIVGRAADRNVFMNPNGPGNFEQLRFLQREHSYVLYGSEPSRVHGEEGASGLMIFHKDREIGAHSCRRHAELKLWERGVPRIPEDSSGAPSAWESGDAR